MANNTSLIYSRPTEIAGAPDFFLTFLSEMTGGTWGYLIVGIMFSTSYLALSGYNPRKAFAASSFTAFVSTVMLSSVGVVGSYLFTLTALMTVLGILLNRGGESVRR